MASLNYAGFPVFCYVSFLADPASDPGTSLIWCVVLPGVGTEEQSALCLEFDHTLKGCSLFALTLICTG